MNLVENVLSPPRRSTRGSATTGVPSSRKPQGWEALVTQKIRYVQSYMMWLVFPTSGVLSWARRFAARSRIDRCDIPSQRSRECQSLRFPPVLIKSNPDMLKSQRSLPFPISALPPSLSTHCYRLQGLVTIACRQESAAGGRHLPILRRRWQP